MADQTVSILGKFEDGISSPLSSVVGMFGKLETSVGHLTEKLEPLTGKAESLITALGAGAVFEESLRNAEKEVEAEAVLLNALRGRKELLGEVEEKIAGIQERSTAGREELLRLAATFASAGISAEKIPDALEATLNTAKALNKPVEAIANEIIRAQSGASGRIGSQIPELKELIKLGGDAGDVIRILNERFSGTAEAVAKTPFGQVKKDFQEIEDISEDLGKELIKIKAAAVDALLSDLKQFDAGIGTDGFKALINVAVELTPYLVRIAEVMVAISATAALARFVGFWISLVGPLASIATSLAAIGAVIGAIGLGVYALVQNTQVFGSLSESASDGFKATLAYVVEIIQKLGDGRLKLADIFTILETKVVNLGLFLKGFLIDPVVNFVKATIDAASAGVTVVFDSAKLGALRLVDFLQTAFLTLIRNVASAFDAMINAVVDGLNKLPGVDIAFRSNAAGAVPKVFADLSKSIDQTQASLDTAITTMTEAYPDAVKQTAEDVNSALDQIALNNADLDSKLTASEAKNAEDRKKKQEQDLKDELDRRKRLDAELSSSQQSLATAARGSPEADPQLKLTLLQEQLAAQDKGLEIAQEDLRLAQERQDLVRQALVGQAETIQSVKAENDAKADTAAAAQHLLQVERDRQRTLADIATANKAVTDETRKQASDELAGLQAARQGAASKLQENAQLRGAGLITKSEREALDTAALDEFNAKVQDTTVSVQALLASLPPEEVEKLQLQLNNLSKALEKPANVDQGFFKGILQGIEQTTAAVDNLGKVGAEVGNTLVSGIQDGIINVFIRGKESVSDWAGNLLESIATIIEKMLILEGIEVITTALGFGGGGEVPFAEGGQVGGVRTGYDSVSARLTPGEYVMDVGTVDHYGVGAMRAMQSRSIPRDMFGSIRDQSPRSHAGSGYAQGGSVSGRSYSGATQAATIVSSEQEMDRLLAGQGPALDRYLERRGYRRGRG